MTSTFSGHPRGTALTRRVLAGAAVFASFLSPPIEAQEPRPSIATAIVLASSLNIRDRPSLEAEVVSTAVRGDTLCVVQLLDDWALIRARTRGEPAPRVEGYAARGFLSESRASRDRLAETGCSD